MNILFMCVANSARSQLAEGLARAIFGREAEIESAGSQPSQVNPLATQSMKEIGLDISTQYSKSVNGLSPKFLSQLDYVITLCAEEVCPVTVAKGKKLHWPMTDPGKEGSKDEKLQSFRKVRDEIKVKLLALKAEAGA
jgi:arsenate reductase